MCDSNISEPSAAVPGSFLLTDDLPLVRIGDLGIIRVTGSDAVEFLHGQFTNAVKGLGKKHVCAGYCSPKGRLLATMRIWTEGDSVKILLPKSVAPGFLKRIRMYVMRADVRFADTYEAADIYGICSDAAGILNEKGLELPARGETARTEDTVVLGLGERALVIHKRGSVLFEENSVSSNSARWWLSEIRTGEATVWPSTRELFVPQAVNFELTGGVVFNKGCYPGQEVVSRVQHIGKSSRRAFIARADSSRSVSPGDSVWSDGKESGTIIESVRSENETYVLFSGLIASEEKGFSLLKDSDPLEIQALPYVIKNVLFD